MENKEIKQSSVEWLIQSLEELETIAEMNIGFLEYDSLRDQILNHAKKLHRDEIIEAFWDGRNKSEPRLSQDYYDEVFGIWQYNQD